MKLKTLLLTSLISLGLAVSYPVLADEPTQARKDHLKKVSKKFSSEWRILKAKSGWTCEVYIFQDRDGNVLKSNVSKCNTDDKRFISQTKKAIKLASPFPRASDEVFTNELILHPKIRGDIDIIKSLRKRVSDGDSKAIKAVEIFKQKIDELYKNGDPKIVKLIDDENNAINAVKIGDYETAFKIWLPFAEKGDMVAQWNIGRLYYLGKGVTKDLDEAIYWYEKSAEQGDKYARKALQRHKTQEAFTQRLKEMFRSKAGVSYEK